MSLDHDDYATLARIEDRLRRIADALEGCGGDRACTIRSHWAPPKRNPGDLRPGERRWDDCETRGPNRCEPGCVRPSLHDGDCRGPVEGSGAEGLDLNAQTAFPATIREAIEQERERNANSAFCSATMPGHWCTRREHADDRHVWAMSDEEAERILRAGQELGFVAEPDPLDESDHRPRHDGTGRHWTKRAENWCECPTWECPGIWTLKEAAQLYGPLTFCDCPDAIGATD